jgi:acyl dehydratase
VLPPEIVARIDEYVARTRELTGQEVREREPRNTEVSADAIRQFAYGTDDDNPLWRDADYAAGTG